MLMLCGYHVATAVGFVHADALWVCRPGMPKYDPRCLAYYWNWFNKSGIEYYLNNYVAPIAALDGYDAIFFDGADEWMEQGQYVFVFVSVFVPVFVPVFVSISTVFNTIEVTPKEGKGWRGVDRKRVCQSRALAKSTVFACNHADNGAPIVWCRNARPRSRSHTWAVASNVPKGATAADAMKAMMDVRVQTSELLIKEGKYPLYSEHLGDTNPTEQT